MLPRRKSRKRQYWLRCVSPLAQENVEAPLARFFLFLGQEESVQATPKGH